MKNKVGRPSIPMKGKVFSKLTVKSLAGTNSSGEYLWNVECSCGTKKTISGADLRSGKTQSCGCQKSEGSSARAIARNTTHKMAKTPTYTSWSTMKVRCANIKNKNYGGATVPVLMCPKWASFDNFFADMGERPTDTSLGRILDRGNYEPGNVFWQTRAEQGLAQRNNHALAKWEAQQCT